MGRPEEKRPLYRSQRPNHYLETPATIRHRQFLPISVLRNREFDGLLSILPAHRNDPW
jgi:hypothetical protein